MNSAGQELKNLRLKAEFSTLDLARALSLSRARVGIIENSVVLRTDTVWRYQQALEGLIRDRDGALADEADR